MEHTRPGSGCLTTPCFVINRQGTLMATSQGDGTAADRSPDRAGDRHAAREERAAGGGLAFFPDGRRLATGGIAGRVTLWDVHARKVLRTIRFPVGVWWVAVSPDGRSLAMQSRTAVEPGSRVEVRDVASNACSTPA